MRKMKDGQNRSLFFTIFFCNYSYREIKIFFFVGVEVMNEIKVSLDSMNYTSKPIGSEAAQISNRIGKNIEVLNCPTSIYSFVWDVFCKRKFPIFAKYFPQAPVGNFLCPLTG